MRPFLFLTAAACLLLTFALTPSCKKKDDGFEQALVLRSDDLTPSGCGYLLRFTNGQLVKPVYVPSAFQYDSLPVLVKYTNTGKESNCMPQNPMQIVSLDDIKRE